jgi:hypothetical protein
MTLLPHAEVAWPGFPSTLKGPHPLNNDAVPAREPLNVAQNDPI